MPSVVARTVLIVWVSLVAAMAASPVNAAGPAPAAPSAQTPGFTVMVLGDGFAQALAEGLRLDFTGQSDVTILDRTHPPYGLSQDARFQWPVSIGNALAGPVRVGAAVVMLGFDDTRPLRDGTTTVAPGAPRWAQLYGDRVEALVAVLKAKQIPVSWVGLPVTSDPDLSAKFAAINEIIRDRATKAGANFVDSWDAFVDENGKYSQTGPDINGRPVRLRMSDGVDFTREGARKLASFADPDLRRDRDRSKSTQADPTAGIVPGQLEPPDGDINALIRREVGLPALPSAEGDHGAPAAAVGPVVPLTAPPLSQDGSLAEGAHPALAEIGGTLAQKALLQGQPIQPQPGRMDDFTWPRQP